MNKDKLVTQKGSYYENIVYYEDEFHGRNVTIAILLSRSYNIYMGMSICCPQDEVNKDLGKNIARGRAEACFDSRTIHNKALKVASINHINNIVKSDKYFLEQIARSFFYDFKSNPKKYIKSFDNE